jgi:hypothetical protein
MSISDEHRAQLVCGEGDGGNRRFAGLVCVKRRGEQVVEVVYLAERGVFLGKYARVVGAAVGWRITYKTKL